MRVPWGPPLRACIHHQKPGPLQKPGLALLPAISTLSQVQPSLHVACGGQIMHQQIPEHREQTGNKADRRERRKSRPEKQFEQSQEQGRRGGSRLGLPALLVRFWDSGSKQQLRYLQHKVGRVRRRGQAREAAEGTHAGVFVAAPPPGKHSDKPPSSNLQHSWQSSPPYLHGVESCALLDLQSQARAPAHVSGGRASPWWHVKGRALVLPRGRQAGGGAGGQARRGAGRGVEKQGRQLALAWSPQTKMSSPLLSPRLMSRRTLQPATQPGLSATPS